MLWLAVYRGQRSPALQEPAKTQGCAGELALWCLRAAHLENLSSRLELVALLPVGQEVNGLAHMVPGVLDLKTAPVQQLPGHILSTSEQPLWPLSPRRGGCTPVQPASDPRSSPSKGETTAWSRGAGRLGPWSRSWREHELDPGSHGKPLETLDRVVLNDPTQGVLAHAQDRRPC